MLTTCMRAEKWVTARKVTPCVYGCPRAFRGAETRPHCRVVSTPRTFGLRVIYQLSTAYISLGATGRGRRYESDSDGGTGVEYDCRETRLVILQLHASHSSHTTMENCIHPQFQKAYLYMQTCSFSIAEKELNKS